MARGRGGRGGRGASRGRGGRPTGRRRRTGVLPLGQEDIDRMEALQADRIAYEDVCLPLVYNMFCLIKYKHIVILN